MQHPDRFSELRAALRGGPRAIGSLSRALTSWVFRRVTQRPHRQDVHLSSGSACTARGTFFCDTENVRLAAASLSVPERVAAIEPGERVCSRRFVLSTGEISFSGPIPWHRVGDDPEDTFTLNRMHFLRDLARAYAMTGESRFARAAESLLTEWINANPLGMLPAWEIYSVAERIVNLSWCVRLFNGSDAERLRTEASALIACSAQFLKRNLERRNGCYNNHLINDARGLWFAGILFDFSGAERCRATAQDILEMAIREKVTAGGWYDEGSTAYHLLLTRTFLECLLLGMINGLTFSAGYRARAGRMWDCCRYLGAAPSGRPIPLIGDICPDNNISELTEVIPRLAYLLGARQGEDIPASRHTVWYQAAAPGQIFCDDGNVHTIPNAQTTEIFASLTPRGGIWMRCPRRYPRTTGSHEHYDAGSLVYAYDGVMIMPDPGTWTYQKEGLLASMSSFVHSGIVVDGFEQAVFPPALAEGYGSWYTAGTRIDAEIRTADVDVCSYVFSGFSRIDPKLLVRRTILCRGHKAVIIFDTLVGQKDTHCFETRFNIAGEADADHGIVHVRCSGVRCDLKVRPGDHPRVTPMFRAPRYGARETMTQLIFSGDERWMDGAWYVVLPVRAEGSAPCVRVVHGGVEIEDDDVCLSVRSREAMGPHSGGTVLLDRDDILVELRRSPVCAA